MIVIIFLLKIKLINQLNISFEIKDQIIIVYILQLILYD